VTRRELLSAFAGGILAPSLVAAQSDEPQYAGLDRVEFYVSNVEKSRDFFVRVFGNTLKKRNEKRYVKLGSAYMAFEPPRGNAPQIRVDHYSVSIKGLEMPKLHAFLDRRGVAYQDYPSGRDTAVVDPEGIRTQLSPENGWSFLNTPNFPAEDVGIQDAPIFQPAGLDHVLLNVAAPEKSVDFYSRFLGLPVERRDNRIWFQAGSARVGLLQTPQGQRPGVNHFCVSAAPFQIESAAKALERIGATAVQPSSEAPGAITFQDPDGFRIQVLSRT